MHLAAPLAAYGSLLASAPVATNLATACLLGLAGDAIAQAQVPAPYDKRRACSFVTFNAAYRGGFQLYAFPAMFAACQGRVLGRLTGLLPLARGEQVARALERTLCNQLLIVPAVYYPLYFIVSGHVQQLSPRESVQRARREFWRIVQKNWTFWMPINLLQFLMLPPQWQVTASCILGLIWNTILSLIAGNVHTDPAPAKLPWAKR